MDVREPKVFSGWSLSLYPGAGEAGGCFVPAGPRRHSTGVKGAAADPDRAAQEAGRRARSRLRRYCGQNRLNRLGTLTYGPPRCTDPVQVRRDVGAFFRELRQRRGGDPFPYVWVPELHKDGVHFHVHFAVGGFIPVGLIRSVWGRGFVHMKLLSDLPVGSGQLGEARRAAAYLSKYVSKTFTDEGAVLRPPGMHRFDVAQGFAPRVMRLEGSSRDAVIDAACGAMGGLPARSWSSDDVEDWKAPPALWLQWDC